MTFTRKRIRECPKVKFNNIELQDETQHIHLGLTLSYDATWVGTHQSNIKKVKYLKNVEVRSGQEIINSLLYLLYSTRTGVKQYCLGQL